MIVAKINLRKIPDKCTECRFTELGIPGLRCVFADKQIPYFIDYEKDKWYYVKPDWCPLMEADE